ncbi:hypothetical protein [Paraburkholderia tropica]|uniref:hypothetical protein n=1 Tax=Paraburkholderia tropica TaxID=92647 RepID=UPI0031CE195C
MKRATVWDFVGASCVIFLVGLLVQVASNIILGSHSTPDVWMILGALATAAATIVALWVALKSDRERARNEAIRARLAAAHVAPILLQAVAKLRVVVELVGTTSEQTYYPDRVTRASTILGQIVEMRPTIEDLRAASPLPDDCADRIAAGFAQTELMARIMDDDLTALGQGRIAVDRISGKGSMYSGMTRGILATLTPAVEICNNASKIKIGGLGVKSNLG